MKDFASGVMILLPALIPLGIYCLLLAQINRRSRPLMVGGVWDALGLLGAASGFLLWTIPNVLEKACRHVVNAVDAPYLYSSLWIIYIAFAAFFSLFLVYLRSPKTAIYNVDTRIFNAILEQSLARVGLSMQMDRGSAHVRPAPIETGTDSAFMERPANTASAAIDRRYAELTVENFPAMCHVTLHWLQGATYVRRQIEEELDRCLDLAAPEENAAAGWFYTVTGVIFGGLMMVAMTILFVILFPKQ